MCFNRVHSIRIGAAVLGAVLLTAAGARPLAGRVAVPADHSGQVQVVDRIVAVVNDQIVTLIEVRVVEAFAIIEVPLSADLEASRRMILEKLIDQKVVVELARDKPPIDPVRIAAEIERIALRMGEEDLRSRLSRFGFTREDLRPYIEEKIRAETVILERFGRIVTVSLKEIEARYQDRFLPAEKAAGREPRPFLAVVDALEQEIKAEKISIQTALWVQSLRDQAEIEIRPDILKK